MKRLAIVGVVGLLALVACVAANHAVTTNTTAKTAWDVRAAANYLDGRQAWWQSWPTASRDHGTSCVSCHTALPYALARPVLAGVLGERDEPVAGRKLLADVVTRVTQWNDVDPFYPDQTNGIPKSSESRGTESILNALVLATNDARSGRLSDAGRAAFANMWTLQFKRGELNGAWAWLNFKLEPWETGDAGFFGAALAAIAVATAPEGYATTPAIQPNVQALRDYLTRRAPGQSLFNRTYLLWAASGVPGVLSAGERKAITDAILRAQRLDGGWSMSSLGEWKRSDNSPADSTSDGYATGLVALALQQSGSSAQEPHVSRALQWLVQHQDKVTGQWTAASLNRKRDATASGPGTFMSDAATGYAVLALTQAGRASGSLVSRESR